MFKRFRGFVFGVLTTVAVIFAAVHFGFVKVDFTKKVPTAIDYGRTLILECPLHAPKDHLCTCECHSPGAKIVHFTACCHRCPHCRRNIVASVYDEHEEECRLRSRE